MKSSTFATSVGMLTHRLFAHAMKKHNVSLQEYIDLFNIDLNKSISSKGGYYKNDEYPRRIKKYQAAKRTAQQKHEQNQN